MHPPHTPTVGGQSARIIADIIRTFPVRLGPCECRFLTAKPHGQAQLIFEMAYAVVELEVMSDPPCCQCAEVTHPPTADEIEWLIVSEMMSQARRILGEEAMPDAFTGCTRTDVTIPIRAGIVTPALKHEKRRLGALRDVEILTRLGPHDDLNSLARFASQVPEEISFLHCPGHSSHASPQPQPPAPATYPQID